MESGGADSEDEKLSLDGRVEIVVKLVYVRDGECSDEDSELGSNDQLSLEMINAPGEDFENRFKDQLSLDGEENVYPPVPNQEELDSQELSLDNTQHDGNKEIAETDRAISPTGPSQEEPNESKEDGMVVSPNGPSQEQKESKEEEFVVDYSLKNTHAMTTYGTCQEGFHHGTNQQGDFVDNRTSIRYNDAEFHFDCYSGLCQVTCQDGQGKGTGSSYIVQVKDESCCLTCAHNLVGYSARGRRVKYKDPLMFVARQHEGAWKNCWKLDRDRIRVHPKYNGKADCGFDVAVCSKSKVIGGRNWDNRTYLQGITRKDMVYYADPDALSVGMSIEVAGYPGEKYGRPFKSIGTIAEIFKTDSGGHLLFYEMDTSPGNSGSPIFITDEKFISANIEGTWEKKVCIGLHAGSDRIEKMNFGTLLTPSLYKWIKDGAVSKESTSTGTTKSLTNRNDQVTL